MNVLHRESCRLKGRFIGAVSRSSPPRDPTDGQGTARFRRFVGPGRHSRVVTLEPGESVVVPRGTEHRTCADDEAHILCFERAKTLNTGICN